MAMPDAILGIAQAYRNCTDPRKVNVCVGAYRDENGKPWVLPSVREAEKRIWESPAENKEYLPIDGDRDFVQLAMRFAYGPDMPLDHLAGVQTLSGTGACRVGGTFLSLFNPGKPIYVPNPTVSFGTCKDWILVLSLSRCPDLLSFLTRAFLCPWQFDMNCIEISGEITWYVIYIAIFAYNIRSKSPIILGVQR